MAFWQRFRNTNLSTQFQRCYIHLPHVSARKPSHLDLPLPNSVFHGRPSTVFHTVRFFAAPAKFQVKGKYEEEDSGGYRLNEKIKSPYIRLVVDDGHSIVSKFEALEQAKKLKLDLVEVDKSAKPPVCKIMDFHKEMYKRQEKEKERAKIRAEMTLRKDIKEVRFSEKTEANDMKNKADMIKKLMEKGYRVKCKVSGKENQDLTALFSPLLALIEDVCIIESGPNMSKKDAFMIVRHIRFGLSKKGGKKSKDATDIDTEEGNTETSSFNSSDSIETESEAEEVLPDGAWSAFSYNAGPEAAFLSRSNDPAPVSENRYKRTNQHGENNLQSNAQVSPAVTENRYKRVEPRNRFQQTPNNMGMNYQGPGTKDAVRPTPPNWNRTRHAPVNVNVNPRIENTNQGFAPPGPRHSMPLHENIPRHPPNASNIPCRPGYGNFSAPNSPPRPDYGNFSGPHESIPKHPGAPSTPRPSSSYGTFSGSKGPETKGVNAGMHRNREGNQ